MATSVAANPDSTAAAVELVAELLAEKDPPSIGLACFNLTQRDAILDVAGEIVRAGGRDDVALQRHAGAQREVPALAHRRGNRGVAIEQTVRALARGSHVLAIPGATRLRHATDNLTAADLTLDDALLAAAEVNHNALNAGFTAGLQLLAHSLKIDRLEAYPTATSSASTG